MRARGNESERKERESGTSGVRECESVRETQRSGVSEKRRAEEILNGGVLSGCGDPSRAARRGHAESSSTGASRPPAAAHPHHRRKPAAALDAPASSQSGLANRAARVLRPVPRRQRWRGAASSLFAAAARSACLWLGVSRGARWGSVVTCACVRLDDGVYCSELF